MADAYHRPAVAGNSGRGAATWLAALLICGFVAAAHAADESKGKWLPVSDGVLAQLQQDGKKVGYPGLTAGVAADPVAGDVFMVVCDQGLWKSTDGGQTFARADGGAVGGRCETGFALDADPAGGRMACFMIYGKCASTADAGKTWQPWKTSHLDFGACDWGATGKALLGLRHESGGVLCLSTDAGQTWADLGKKGPDGKIAKADREYTALGMFDPGTLVASRGAGILRSTDGGQTWATVSDAKPSAGVMRVRKNVGYWATDAGVLASKDKGTTWAVAMPVKAVFGPWFGKDDKQVVAVTKEGFQESTDGGATWKVVAPLPAGFTVGRVGPNYAWDSTRDAFYASTMGKPTFKFQR